MAQPTYYDLLEQVESQTESSKCSPKLGRASGVPNWVEQVESQTVSHLSTAELLTIKVLGVLPSKQTSCFLKTVKRITSMEGDEKEDVYFHEVTLTLILRLLS